VLGKSFTTEALAAVSGRRLEEIRAQLLALIRKELLTLDVDPRSPERGQYGFVQDVIREIAYGTLGRRERRNRHLSAARFFEALGEPEISGVLATHYLEAWRATPEGQERDAIAAQARIALRAAIDRARSLHANSAALEHIEQALTVTSDPAERAALWVAAAEPAEAALGHEAAQAYLLRALDWYREQGDAARVNRTTLTLAGSLLIAGHSTRARELIVGVVQRIDRSTDPALAASAYNELARSQLFAGRGAPALEALEHGLAVAERHGLERETAELFITKSWAVDSLGRPREAAVLARAGLELSDALEYTPGRLRARMNLSNVLMVDDPKRGLAVARAAIEIAVKIGHADWAATLSGNAGMASLLAGDWAETVDLVAPLDRDFLHLYARAAVVGTRWVLGAFRDEIEEDEAGSRAMRAMAEADVAQNRAIAHATRALMTFAGGRPEEVAQWAREAAREVREARESLIAIAFMGRAGLRLRDAPLADEAVCEITEGWSDSGWTRIVRDELQAGVDALSGNPTAADARFREAIERYRALGLTPEVGNTIVEMLELLGTGVAGADELRAEAARIADSLGYRSLRKRLEALDAAPSPPPARAEVVAR
jgi:hypothetical protein